jgi:MoaA/NifB/PqqE/SkfB family radical SAM enzyme
MDKSSTYCVMPHLGMSVQNYGDFCCCNINKASWQSPQREVVHVHNYPVEKIYQSHTRKTVAAALDHGIKHSSCQACWDLESAGGNSPRVSFNQLFRDVEVLPNQPRVLIIKPGNTCNFSCRMCNPITSSNWYADGYELEKENLASNSWYADTHKQSVAELTYNEYTKTFETVRNSFNRDNVDFWETMKTWIPNLVDIIIYGGEPFLIPAMFDLLEHGVKIGSSKNIKISLHTNASIFNQQYLDILSNYKSVEFHVSLDSGDSAQLEYIRHKAKFEAVMDNVIRFKKFFDQNKNIHPSITITVTLLNVFYIDKIIKHIEQLTQLPTVLNITTTPEYDIRHLPVPVKKYLINHLSHQLIINFLQQTIAGCDIEWPKFCRATDKLDQLRGQSFKQTFPEWWQLLEPYWIK